MSVFSGLMGERYIEAILVLAHDSYPAQVHEESLPEGFPTH